MSQKKVQRTEQFETAVKTAIMDDMCNEQLQDALFENLLKKGLIRTDGDGQRIRRAANRG